MMVLKDLLFVLVVILVWGVNFVVIKVGLYGMLLMLFGVLCFMFVVVFVVFFVCWL